MAIDRENILEATMMAMRQAAKDLSPRPRILFVDGNRAPGTGLLERLVVDGDAISCAVGAASILAKAHRDALMIAMEERHPGYGFGQHKGYGTALHRARIAELGVSPIHRISYAPVAALQLVDEDLRDALHLAKAAGVVGLAPEPLRLAHLVATAVRTGESGNRA